MILILIFDHFQSLILILNSNLLKGDFTKYRLRQCMPIG